MNMPQCDIIVDKLYTNGLLYEDEIVDYIKKTGAVFDKGLLVARVKTINKNAEKYMLPAGTKVVSSPFLVNGYTKRLYVLGVEDLFIPIKVNNEVKKSLKTFYSKA
jgi:hypothetical protein